MYLHYSPCLLLLLFLLLTVPEDYDYNPSTGRRGDKFHHAELKCASTEYIAPSEYMVCVCVCVYMYVSLLTFTNTIHIHCVIKVGGHLSIFSLHM